MRRPEERPRTMLLHLNDCGFPSSVCFQSPKCRLAAARQIAFLGRRAKNLSSDTRGLLDVMNEKLRISGGTRRGRKLESPPAESIRPASDLVRQAVFNLIRYAIPGCVFHDIYAGTGIVGIEALSRGAKLAIFLDRDGKQVSLIRRNLRRVDFGPECAIERGGDAFVWAKHFVPEADARNVVFLGPPYPDFEKHLDKMMDMVATVQGRLGDADLLVLQFPRFVEPAKLPDFENWFRLRHYGKTRVGVWQRNSSLPDKGEESEVDGQQADRPHQYDEADGDNAKA